MYESLCRRRGRKRDAGACARLGSADFHEGSRHDFLGRHEREASEAVHGNAQEKGAFIEKLSRRMVDSRNVMCAWDYIAARSGETPGVDGMRCSDLSDAEAWDLVRTTCGAIEDGSYRPAPDKTLSIPKTGGNGFRSLSIPTVIDRTVQRAIVQAIQPFVDQMLDANSMGFRPKRSCHKALAKAEKLAVGQVRWFWVAEDLKDAFPSVPQNRLLDVIQLYTPNPELVRLIETVIRTDSGRGLRQGGNLSPFLLNLYLDHHLDRPWRHRHPDIPLIRYADDILLLCRSRMEAEAVYAEMKKMLLPAAMSLKGSPETAIRDLEAGQDVS